MKVFTHEQTRSAILSAADNLLGEEERISLDAHLSTCTECRAYAAHMEILHTGLKQAFHDHWDATPAPQRPLVTALPIPENLLPRLGRIGANLLLLALWLWLYWAVFAYLRVIFSREEFRTNQIVLAGVLLLIISQARRIRIKPRLDTLPHLYLPALALVLGGSVLYLVVERFLDINTLSASLFALASYGLLGLWLSPRRWQEGLPAALLLIGTLPFGDHLQNFIGYPMRIATATVVRDALQAFGVHSVGVDTILVFESGLAQVDIPCSGIKSLWTGMLFLIAATWIERKPINFRWMGIAILFAGMLFGVNLARVGTLVAVGQVAGWTIVAEMIHIPLGVMGFIAACGGAVILIKQLKPRAGLLTNGEVVATGSAVAGASAGSQPKPQSLYQPRWLVPLLAAVITGMALLYSPRPLSAVAQATISWSFPVVMNVTADPLTPELLAWVTEDGAESAERWNFEWYRSEMTSPLRGAMMFLTSNTWRGQHYPERCFEVEGLTVKASQTVMVSDDFPAKLLTLSNKGSQASAAYWLQTGDHPTDDFGTRIWADLTPERQRWVLVTVLFQQTYPPEDADLRAFLGSVRAVVARGLEGDLP